MLIVSQKRLFMLFIHSVHICPMKLFPLLIRCFSVLYLIHEPRSYDEAIKDKRCVDAMASELEALQLNHTWDLVPLPLGKLAIGC